MKALAYILLLNYAWRTKSIDLNAVLESNLEGISTFSCGSGHLNHKHVDVLIF